jgi:hypothetical protein
MTTTPLKWGVDPLAEQQAAATLLRDVLSLVLSQEQAGPALKDLVTDLSQARDRLAAEAPPSFRARVGEHADGEGRVYIDHTTDIGAFNPIFPTYTIDVEGPERATGTVNFPICYEGPAGGVNGGVLGVFFDAVVQHHNCVLGVSGATRDLAIVYRRKTPLLIDLDFEIIRTLEERSVLSEVFVRRGETLVCSATTRAALFNAESPTISPRR